MVPLHPHWLPFPHTSSCPPTTPGHMAAQCTHAYVITPKQGWPVRPRSTLHSAAPTLASGEQPIVRPYASGGWNRCTWHDTGHNSTTASAAAAAGCGKWLTTARQALLAEPQRQTLKNQMAVWQSQTVHVEVCICCAVLQPSSSTTSDVCCACWPLAPNNSLW